MAHIPQILDAIGAVAVALGLLVPALQTLVGVLAKAALLTATTADDAAVGKVSAALSAAAGFIAKVERALPRAAFGKPNPVVDATIAAAQIQNGK